MSPARATSLAAWSRYRPSRRALCFLLAIILPVLSAPITARVPAFHPIPFALYFLSTVLVAALGGLAPSLLAVAVTMVVSRTPQFAFHNPRLFLHTDFLRYLVLLSAALLISLVSDRRRRSEAQLHSAIATLEDRTASLIDSLASSKCACWTFDLNSGVSPRWYHASYQVFGRPFSELEALPTLLPLLHPDDQPRLPGVVYAMRNSWDPIFFEHRVPWPNGELHTLEMRANRVPGVPCVWRGVTVDITDRKLAEAALLRAEKLAAMGRLASTVAHEINNPLEAVTNLLYLARTTPHIDPQTDDFLASAERELARLSNITRLTLGFVRTNARVVETDIATTLDEVLSILQHRLDSWNVRVDRLYQPGLFVSIAPHELRQIVTNLIANAVDAVSHPNAHIRLSLAREASTIILLVADNGSGIAPSNLARIFEPFFSTKEEVGTGIGLWVTRELVEKNAGHISVQSRLPPLDPSSTFTTTFRVEFPAASIPAAPGPAAPGQVTAPQPTRDETSVHS